MVSLLMCGHFRVNHYDQPFGAGIIIIFFNFNTFSIQNVNNTGTKQDSIMKQTAFWTEKNGEYRACLKYSVLIFVE